MKRREERRYRVAYIRVAPTPSGEAWERILAALEAHSPAVEEDDAGEQQGVAAYLDARGVIPRYGSEETWARAVLSEVWLHTGGEARLGLAGSKFAAWVAAGSAGAEAGYHIVTEGDRAFLASQPLETLPLPREARRRAYTLGLRTIGQFAALPETSVAEQFGLESVIAHRWARGLDDRPVHGRRLQVVKARHEFEVPEVRREALVQVAMQLTQRALHDLLPPREAWAIKRLQLEARFQDGTAQRHITWLGVPPGPETTRALWGHLVDRMAGATSGVAAIGVCLVGLEPATGRQLDLFAHARGRFQLEQTLRLLAKKHSPACVVRANLLDAREPLVSRRYGLRGYRP